MSPKSFRYPSTFKLFCFVLILPCIISKPVSVNTYYDDFIKSLLVSNCKMPKEIDLPFPESSDPNPFNYLSVPLKECHQSLEALTDDLETHLLCQETFEVLHNITCSQFNVSFPLIKSNPSFKDDVCISFMGLKNIIPKRSLAHPFGDNINICYLLCRDKFQALCQTLLWSYDVQAQIEDVLKNKQDAGKESVGTVLPNQENKDTAENKPTEVEDEGANNNAPDADNAENGSNVKNAQLEPIIDGVDRNHKDEDQPFAHDDAELKSKEISNNNLEENHLVPAPSVTKSTTTSAIPVKPGTPDITQNTPKNAEIPKLTSPAQSSTSGTNATNKQNLPIVETDKEIQGGNVEVKTEAPPLEENKVVDKAQAEGPITNNQNNQPSNSNVGETSVAVVTAGNKEVTPKVPGSNITINNVQGSASTVSIPANNPEENDLNNVNFQEEEEPKDIAKQTESQVPSTSDKDKNPVKPDVTNSEISSSINIDTDLKFESTTLQAFSDKNIEEDPEDRDAEQYYKNALNDINAGKQNIKTSVGSEVANPNDVPNSYNHQSGNTFVRGHEVDPVIPAFPEQEDSHFFFYFLSIVLILMAGYLIFHNKQKILALIVEGRHERRRRSHGAAYKKLETK